MDKLCLANWEISRPLTSRDVCRKKSSPSDVLGLSFACVCHLEPSPGFRYSLAHCNRILMFSSAYSQKGSTLEVKLRSKIQSVRLPGVQSIKYALLKMPGSSGTRVLTHPVRIHLFKEDLLFPRLVHTWENSIAP